MGADKEQDTCDAHESTDQSDRHDLNILFFLFILLTDGVADKGRSRRHHAIARNIKDLLRRNGNGMCRRD